MLPFRAPMMAKRFSVGGGGDYTNVKQIARPTAARYWRTVVERHGSNGAYISEAQYRDTAGGSDLTTISDTMIGTFSFLPTANIFDNNTGTASFGSGDTYFGIDFGSGNSEIVEEVAITNQGSGQDYHAGRMEKSADNVTWEVSWQLHKSTVSGGTATNVFRYDDWTDGLIFDLRATADPPVEQVSGVTLTKTGSPTINTTTQYMQFTSGNVLSMPARTIPNYQMSSTGDFAVEFHVDDCTVFNAPFALSTSQFEVYSVDGKLTLFAGGSVCVTTTNVVLDGAEHHIAIVQNNNVPVVYIDGVSVPLTAATAREWWSYPNTYFIGGETATTRIFPGKLGRLLIWNFARYTGDFTPPAVTDVPLYEP